MTKEEFAAKLNGRIESEEMTREEEAEAKAAGLLVIYGYSDDNVELRGIIDDEVGAWEGTTLRLDREGILPSFDSIDDHDDEEAMAKYFARRNTPKLEVKALWCAEVWQGEEAPSWTFETTAPHATFLVKEHPSNGTGTFCRGIVIDQADMP